MRFQIRLLALITVMLCVAMLVSCTPVQKGNASTAPIPKPVDISGSNAKNVAFEPADALQPEVSDALSRFSLDLFQRVAAADNGKNVFISPLSVWLALGMAYNGASGSTADGMAKALHSTGISVDELNKSNAGLLGVLAAADPQVQVSMANSIWLNKRFDGAVNQEFLYVSKDSYHARIAALDFNDASAPGVINAWVKENTGGKIDNMVGSVSPDTLMYLINAVYFNARWKRAFDPARTRDGEFTASDGKTAKTRFMVSPGYESKFGYANDGICAVRLPYGSGRLELVAVMPYEQSFHDFLNGLTAEKLQSYIDACSNVTLELAFPKFAMEYEAGLNGELKAMGMQNAFDASADFENLSKTMGKDLFISEVKHKANIDVNEAGTQAGAATEAMVPTASMPPRELEFTQPFIYLIRDTKTGAILFIGTMQNPGE